ncbi:hypothetical protein [Burkholderia pseudomallei]|nr:hypothetical protein [Burkholderia pseudomallei]
MADEAVASPYVPTYRDELALVRHLIGVLEEKLAGRDSVRRVNTHPLDWCHLGILGPVKGGHHPVELEAEQVEADADQTESALHSAPASTATPKVAAAPAPKAASEADEGEPVRAQVEGTEDIQGTRRPPSALGFEILLKPDEQGLIEIAVDASFCIFSKHLPTLKEQSSVLESGVSAGAPLVEVVQRWPIQVPGVVFRVNVLERRSVHDDGVVQAELDRTVAQAASRADAERIWPGNRPKLTNPDVLKNEANFTAHLSSLTGGLQVDRSNLEGSLELRVSPRPDGLVRVGCYICNDTPETARDVKGRGLKDAFLIMGDATLHAAVNVGELHPIEILPVPQDYQYDRQVWAVGHNASVRVNQETKEIKTAALAQFEQIRIATVDSPRRSSPTWPRTHSPLCNRSTPQCWSTKPIGGSASSRGTLSNSIRMHSSSASAITPDSSTRSDALPVESRRCVPTSACSLPSRRQTASSANSPRDTAPGACSRSCS